MLGVYIHIPFCERKCSYCAFSSFVTCQAEQKKYVSYLIDEIRAFRKERPEEKYRKIDSIFIGGGTPSLLDGNLFAKIVQTLKQNFIFSDNLEFTIECNPNSLTKEKLRLYKNLGVNRISLGVQSLDEKQLKFIGRLHDRNGAIEAIKQSLKLFDNVSCDLLIGIKDMNKESYLKNLEILTNHGIKHISTYMLQIENGTPLAKLVENDFQLLPSDEDCIDVYNETVKFLKNKGFNQYEVSNFACKGYECRHNIKYWIGEEYVGFGLSAHSYIDKTRKANAKNFEKYYWGHLEMKERLTSEQLIEEHIMLGLRCKEGVNKEYLLNLGYDIEKNEYLAEYIERGIINQNISKTRLYLNPEYYGVNNYIIVHLLP